MGININRTNNDTPIAILITAVHALVDNSHLRVHIIKVSNVLSHETTCIKANTCPLEGIRATVVLVAM